MDTLQFEIAGGVRTNIVLVPPLTGAIVSVTIDGNAWTDFDERSVAIPNTPAQVICRMANAG